MEILEADQLDNFLSEYSDWEEDEHGMIRAEFSFKDFLTAIDFVNQVAEECEVLQHHCDIDIRYNVVILAMCTHDAEGQITDRDVALVQKIEALLE